MSLGFKKTFSIGAPEKGEDEVGEDDEEGVEGRHHVATLPVHVKALEHICLKMIFYDKVFTDQYQCREGLHHIATLRVMLLLSGAIRSARISDIWIYKGFL